MAELLIGERTYRTKESAKAAIYEVRNRVKARGRPTPEDDEFLRDLVTLHPDAEAKVGCGIDHFEVRQNFNYDGFWILRTDGSETDFSFMKCLYGASQEAKVRSAMRYAVVDQKLAARDLAFAGAEILTCPVTGEPIRVSDCHIDHDSPTFVQIADAFAEQAGGYASIETISVDGNIGRRFVDSALSSRWEAFHQERANLRAVSVRANLSVLRRGVQKRPKG